MMREEFHLQRRWTEKLPQITFWIFLAAFAYREGTEVILFITNNYLVPGTLSLIEAWHLIQSLWK